jgi:hypothetical protein
MSVNQIAEAYQISRQSVFYLRTKLQIRADDFRNPDFIFSHLLSFRKSTVRDRLANPETRLEIATKLSK